MCEIYVTAGKLFQSHAGSIEAGFGSTAVAFHILILMFQSHAGSIEARIGRILARWAARGFNPTLVRLRLGIGISVDTGVGGFNPTLVRLRLIIPSLDPARHPSRFNPTLVRLRPGFSVEAIESALRFNPTLVRLRPSTPAAIASPRWRVSIPRWFD